MQEDVRTYCPECEDGPLAGSGLDRRAFLRVAGAGVAGLLATGTAVAVPAPEAKTRKARPAEDLVKELYSTFTADQKKTLVLPYNHGGDKGRLPTRLGMYNGPIAGKRIGANYTPAQQDLIERALRAICAGDDGYRLISRNNTFDSSGSVKGCGAVLFGEPADGKDWSWVFSGHHLTVRCDGKFKDGVGFGGPMYYGHSPNGYSDRNVFFYQTKSVLSVFDALDAKQRKAAVVVGTPGEQYPSVRFRAKDQPYPGIAYTDLSKDQRQLVEDVMHDILKPYRKEDVDEVMGILKDTGGLEKMHLAFYQQKQMKDKEKWHFWRLEGPGFVWNFRVLPHVHTYVHIATKA